MDEFDHKVGYFIKRTDERLHSIEGKIDALAHFKAKTIGETRIAAFLVSAVCGFISTLTCGVVTYFITAKK